jgi:hypothetical protein
MHLIINIDIIVGYSNEFIYKEKLLYIWDKGNKN